MKAICQHLCLYMLKLVPKVKRSPIFLKFGTENKLLMLDLILWGAFVNFDKFRLKLVKKSKVLQPYWNLIKETNRSCQGWIQGGDQGDWSRPPKIEHLNFWWQPSFYPAFYFNFFIINLYFLISLFFIFFF